MIIKKHTPFHFLTIFLQRTAWFPTRMIFAFYIHFKIKGKKNLREVEKMARKRGVIFVANHTSEVDPIMVTAILPMFSKLFPMFYGARQRNFYKHDGLWATIIYSGFFFKIWGAYPIASGTKNYDESLSLMVSILENGGSLCYFPEGKINRTSETIEPHGGVAYLIWKTNAIVLPVHIEGSYNMGGGGFWGRKRNVVLTIKQPMTVNDIFHEMNPSLEGYKRGAKMIMEKVYQGS